MKKATGGFGPYRSPHEGYAFLLGYLDDLWKKLNRDDNVNNFHPEAVQVAVVAMRFLIECTHEGQE